MAEASTENTRSYVLHERNYNFPAIVLNAGSIKGFQACAVVDQSGDVIAENNKENIDLQALIDTMLEVSGVVNQCTKELGIGRFHTGELDGAWGHIYVNILAGKILLTQCDKSGHGEGVLARLERIIESCSTKDDSKNDD